MESELSLAIKNKDLEHIQYIVNTENIHPDILTELFIKHKITILFDYKLIDLLLSL